ncbi:MAG: hypothetical protein FK730_10135 [Asgard group archaeon]|nr:hypothetical protein [Asgard group archaeon]
MKEIFLNCDSPCFSCPIYDRMIKISHFNQRKLHDSYYCNHCDIYSLCKLGLAYRRHKNGKMRATCTKCGNFVERIELSYQEGQDHKPFNANSLLVIRKENGTKFDILQTLKGAYFKDLAEVLLYILYQFGPNNYNIINYNTLTKNYHVIYTGVVLEEKVAVKSDKPTFISTSEITFT